MMRNYINSNIVHYSLCKDSIENYLNAEEKLKQNMSKLSNECPDKVLNFLLKTESKSTKDKLMICTWTDNIDKKYLQKLLIKKCDDL